MKPRSLYRLGTFSIVAASFFNFAVGGCALFRFRRPLDVHISYNQLSPPVFERVPETTNDNIRISFSDVAGAAPSLPSAAVRSYRLPFSYYHLGGRPYVRLGILDYTIGDLHAYGVIRAIFPERIVFDNGDYIDNTQIGEKNVTVGI
jgi:hypothetical protein